MPMVDHNIALTANKKFLSPISTNRPKNFRLKTLPEIQPPDVNSVLIKSVWDDI